MNRWQRRFLGSTSLSYDLTDFELVHFFALTDQVGVHLKLGANEAHGLVTGIEVAMVVLGVLPI